MLKSDMTLAVEDQATERFVSEAAFQKAITERDEARAEAERYRTLIDKLPNEADECRLITDNARLRAALERLQGVFCVECCAPETPLGHSTFCEAASAALAASPSDTLDALRELMACVAELGWHMDDKACGCPACRMTKLIEDPRLAWLRRT